MWLGGDMYKVSYYESKDSPAQLVICAFFACMVDCAILSQFWFYRKLTTEENLKNKKDASIPTDIESVRDTIGSTIEATASESSIDEKGIELAGRLTLQRRSSSDSPIEKGAVGPVLDT